MAEEQLEFEKVSLWKIEDREPFLQGTVRGRKMGDPLVFVVQEYALDGYVLAPEGWTKKQVLDAYREEICEDLDDE